MHSLRKYQGFIIYQTWADIEPFGTDKSVPYEGLINESTIYLNKGGDLMADEGLERVQLAAQRLLDRLEQAVEELDKGTVLLKQKRKTETGEETLELVKAKRKGIVDRAGLKQLTGVLKDLQDILSRDGSLDARERELRLQRLEQELNRQPEAEGITVILEGEADGYAG